TDQPAQPNVVFIMADDLGWGDLGSYGQTKIKTPALDQMAKEGMRFTDFYSGSPVCAPSRCVLLTGKNSGNAYIRGNMELSPEGQLALPDSVTTIAEVMQSAGYTTGGIGKWGLGGPDSEGHPRGQGFDYFYGHLCQRKAHSFYPDYVWENHQKVEFPDNDPAAQKGEYIHDYFTEKALSFIQSNKDKPFFLYLPYTIPHLEFVAPEESMAEYRGKFPEEPFEGTGYHEELPESPDIPFPGNYGPQSHPRAAYAAMITRMDRDIGRINQLLKDLKLDDNTLVIFTSDNGGAQGKGADADFFASNGEFRGQKGRIHEGGIRVPFIAKWPGEIKENTVSDMPAAFWDVMPTLADLAEVKNPVETDGISFLPTLTGGEQEEREYLYWEFKLNGVPMQAVRVGDYKGVKIGDEPLALYNLKNDPAEAVDLAASFPDKIARMNQLLSSARVASDEFPLFN
ncbi:MAG: arylsulfatase, partial [Reichenbachiella sp.]